MYAHDKCNDTQKLVVILREHVQNGKIITNPVQENVEQVPVPATFALS